MCMSVVFRDVQGTRVQFVVRDVLLLACCGRSPPGADCGTIYGWRWPDALADRGSDGEVWRDQFKRRPVLKLEGGKPMAALSPRRTFDSTDAGFA